MTHPAFASAAWFRAMTLHERRQALSQVPAGDEDRSQSPEVARLLEKWREKEPFTSGTIPFETRLEAEGLSPELMRYLLTEPAEELQRRTGESPAWLNTLREAFARPVSSEPLPVPPSLQKMAVVGFLEALRPLIEWGRERLRAHARELGRTRQGLLFAPEAVEPILFAHLPRRLLERINRTMVLEMNVARLQGRLQGETGEERFRHFVESLRNPDVTLALLQEYALLARICTQTVEQWSRNGMEFLTRLADDGPALRGELLAGAPVLLQEITAEAGDQHHAGRSVLILTFSSGIKLVYKPRSLAVDAHFQELLAWLDTYEALPASRLLRFLGRDGYGWCEFVEARPCESEEALARFYVRLGSYLALFQLLGGMDVHYENLIAAGEYPVVVDLETLFHPMVSEKMAFLTDDERAFTQVVDHSVSRIALLPLISWAREDADGVDVGGMGSPDGKLSPRKMLYWEEQGHDTMHQGRRHMLMKGASNLPSLRGQPVALERYHDAICDGYARMCRLIMRERDAVLAPGGPLQRFAQDDIRVLLRSTQIYFSILQEGYHPDLLRDGLERDRYFDALWQGVTRRPFLDKALPSEREALHRGDIPRYAARPDSKDLWSGPGERIPDVLWRTGMEVAEESIRALDEKILERDLWWIRSSLLSAMPSAMLEQPRQPPPAKTGAPVERDRLIAAARTVGDRLLTLAIPHEGSLFWMGAHQSDRNQWPFSPMTLDVYGGMSGVTLFLAQLAEMTGEERFTRAARQTGDFLRRLADWARTRMHVVGGFEGWGGIVYTLGQLGTLWNEPELFSLSERILDTLPPDIEKDRNLDVISGSAGCILGLLALRQMTGSAQALAVAVRCGEHLLAQQKPQPSGGAAWMTIIPSAQPLSGLSHGASGMAYALLELARASGQPRFQDAALEALTYERTLFSPEHQNWRDTRTAAPSQGFTTAWCYGAPGIGLVRARALRHLDEPVLREELRTAVASTREHGFGYNDSLCHGDLGNLELLLEARALGEAPAGLDAFISGTLEAAVSRVERREWRCAVPLGIDTPGLMIGLAGVGWQLLRFAEPGRVPSILMLDAPGAKAKVIR